MLLPDSHPLHTLTSLRCTCIFKMEPSQFSSRPLASAPKRRDYRHVQHSCFRESPILFFQADHSLENAAIAAVYCCSRLSAELCIFRPVPSPCLSLPLPVCIPRSLIFVESYIVLCDRPVSLSLSLGLTHIVVCIRLSSQIKTGRFSILLYKHCVYPLAIMRPVHLFSPVADSAELVCPGILSGPCFPFFGVCITCVCVFSFLRNCISYTAAMGFMRCCMNTVCVLPCFVLTVCVAFPEGACLFSVVTTKG